MLFEQTFNAYASLYNSGSLWKDCFKLFELTEPVCQKDDARFVELLERLRTASCTTDDYTLLQSHKISLHNATYPRAALHVFRTKNL